MFWYAAAMSASLTARARVRAELTREILAAAHTELASEGASGLSLRAVARRLQMVPSALYRYFPNRDALLTALIIDAYEAVGAAAQRADRAAAADPLARWMAVTAAVRLWGQEHPHEWALVYGSPVPGYRAPQDTVAAALEVTTVLGGIFAGAHPLGAPAPASMPTAPPGLDAVLEPLQAALLPGRGPEVLGAALLAWTQLFGMVSLELFGHYVGATTDFDAAFDYAMRTVARVVGLPDA
jgi:AcrR family transcriptional regulator